jgi:hypothetical protein
VWAQLGLQLRSQRAGAGRAYSGPQDRGVGAEPDDIARALARGIPGIGAPAHGQLHANAHQSTVASTPVTVGIDNRFFLRNAAGRTSVNLWSFGTFEAWPAPSARSYASDGTVSTSPYSSAPGPVRTVYRAVRLR